MRFRMISGMLVLSVCLIAAGGCEKKGEEPKAEGALEISVEPDPVTIAVGEGDYTIRITAREIGGAAVDLTKATVVITYLDSTHIMLGEIVDLTATQMTWTATTPEEGGPAVALLEEFWHLEAGASKKYELPLEVGTEMTAPEEFPGVYFSVLYVQAAQAAGKSGFMITLTYEATDANGHLLFGTVSLRIQIQT